MRWLTGQRLRASAVQADLQPPAALERVIMSHTDVEVVNGFFISHTRARDRSQPRMHEATPAPYTTLTHELHLQVRLQRRKEVVHHAQCRAQHGQVRGPRRREEEAAQLRLRDGDDARDRAEGRAARLEHLRV